MTRDDDDDWQEDCFRLMRVVIGVTAEYSALIDENSPAGWALADLRSMNRDLLQILEEADETAAPTILAEARALLAEFLRLAG